jgi:hypothetical protein
MFVMCARSRLFVVYVVAMKKTKGGERSRGSAIRKYIKHWWCVGEDAKVVILDAALANEERKLVKKLQAYEVTTDKQEASGEAPGSKLIFLTNEEGKQRLYWEKYATCSFSMKSLDVIVNDTNKEEQGRLSKCLFQLYVLLC